MTSETTEYGTCKPPTLSTLALLPSAGIAMRGKHDGKRQAVIEAGSTLAKQGRSGHTLRYWSSLLGKAYSTWLPKLALSASYYFAGPAGLRASFCIIAMQAVLECSPTSRSSNACANPGRWETSCQ